MTIASFNSIDKATRVVKLFFLAIFQLFMGLQHCFTQRTAKESVEALDNIGFNYHQLPSAIINKYRLPYLDNPRQLVVDTNMFIASASALCFLGDQISQA
jgi:hypothetical protein